MSFRRVLGFGLLSASAYATLIEPRRVVVRRFEVVLPGLPMEADGLRIAQLSDLHASAIVPRDIIRRAVDACLQEAPDMIALTGDFVSRRGSYLPFVGLRQSAKPVHVYAAWACEELKRLRAPEGVFGVLGNHDHASDKGDEVSSGAWLETKLRESGVQILTNASARVRGLRVAGVDDWRSGAPDLQAALQDGSRDEPVLLLSHNPRVTWLLRDRNALVLAGHTHGGQVRIPGLPLQRGRLPGDVVGSLWTHGWYQLGRARLYVNAGVGMVSVPFRFNCPPEIAVFTLRAE